VNSGGDDDEEEDESDDDDDIDNQPQKKRVKSWHKRSSWHDHVLNVTWALESFFLFVKIWRTWPVFAKTQA